MNDFAGLSTKVNLEMDPSGDFGFARISDNRVNVNFYTRSVQNPEKSREQGKPWFENQIYVRIQPAGERLNIIDRPVYNNDKQMYPAQWRQFTLNQTQVPEGTPVELLFPNFPAIADTLKGAGVWTIQQLAELSGNGLDGLGMGGQEFVNKAQRYLQQAKDGSEMVRLQQDLDRAKSDNKSLKRQMSEQIGIIKQLQSQVAQIMTTQPGLRDQTGLGHVQGVDVQTERINALHVTKQIKQNNISDALEIGGLDD